MLTYYQQLTKQLNVRKQKQRYKAKRQRRAYLTEAYLGGELALYKPAYASYKVFTDKIKWVKPEVIIEDDKTIIDGVEMKMDNREIVKAFKTTWFDKLIMWIRKVIK